MLAMMRTIIYRECLLTIRRLAEWLNPLLFFIIVVSLFPLAVSPDRALLHTIAPGLIWVTAVLASMMASERLFHADFIDGSLEQWLLTPWPLPWLILLKLLTQWVLLVVPLIIICPLLGFLLSMTAAQLHVLIYSLLLGTPCLCLLTALVVALTLGLPGGRLLLALLLLPLYVPILIFAAGSVANAGMGVAVYGQLALLAALLLLLLVLAPVVIAAALRLSLSQ